MNSIEKEVHPGVISKDTQLQSKTINYCDTYNLQLVVMVNLSYEECVLRLRTNRQHFQ